MRGWRGSDGAREVLERRSIKAVPGPLVRRDGTDRPVERDRRLVPVENGPLQPTAAPVEGETSQRREQCRSHPESAMRGPDVEILEIDAGSSRPGGEAPVVQGHADDEVAGSRDPRESARLPPEQRELEHRVVDLDPVACPLVLSELTDQLDQDGDIGSSRCTYHLLDRIRGDAPLEFSGGSRFRRRSSGVGPWRIMECLDDDGEKVRVGEDETENLLLLEPCELIVLLRRTILRFSRPGVDDEDTSVELSSSQPRDKTSGIGSDHDSELFEQLAGEGIAIRLALSDVTTRRVPAVRSPQPRRVPVNEQNSPRAQQQAAHDVVEPGGSLGHSLSSGGDRSSSVWRLDHRATSSSISEAALVRQPSSESAPA